jgi:tRNA nucleotidyltransferase/poly(A) polymerase
MVREAMDTVGSDTSATRREQAVAIVRRLQAAGHQAVFAGGCVRDDLLHVEPVDYDIATSALPEQVEALFEHTIPVGKQFGILLVPGSSPEAPEARGGSGGEPAAESEGTAAPGLPKPHYFEVATFRRDDVYLDGRRPVTVHFADIRSDAERRDFTINAMFEDPVTGEILDYVGGRDDLAAGILRAVGDPVRRFAEDRLRLLRGVRFSARFGFPIEEATLAAMVESAAEIKVVSAERIGEELVRMLTEGHARRSFEMLDQTGLLVHVLPEISAMKGCEQSPDSHPEGDVFVHTMICIGHLQDRCSESLALGVLLHDVSKPSCAATTEDGRRTFYGHTRDGARVAEEIVRRLRRSNATVERVGFLVDQHLRHCAAAGMRKSTLKRFLRQDGIEELMELARIDALSSNGDLGHYDFCAAALAELSTEQMKPAPLLSGRDLMTLGLSPGPGFKTILAAVEDAQLEGTLTSRDAALDFVRANFLT